MGALYSAISGLLAFISRAHPRFLSCATEYYRLGSSVVIVVHACLETYNLYCSCRFSLPIPPFIFLFALLSLILPYYSISLFPSPPSLSFSLTLLISILLPTFSPSFAYYHYLASGDASSVCQPAHDNA